MMLKSAADSLRSASSELEGMVPYLLSKAMSAETAAQLARAEGVPADSSEFRMAINDAVSAIRRAIVASAAIHTVVVGSEPYERWHEDVYGVRTDGSVSEEREKSRGVG